MNRKTYHGPEAPAIFGSRRLSDNLAGAAMAVFVALVLQASIMRISTVVICAFVIGGALALEGCGHKLVAHNGESTVAVYPDENTFVKLTNLKNQGGVGGMIGGLGEGIAAKQVDNNTPVRIINSDDKGSQVEVLDGALAIRNCQT